MNALAKSSIQIQARLLHSHEGKIFCNQSVTIKCSNESGFEVYDGSEKIAYVDDFWSRTHLENMEGLSTIVNAWVKKVSGRSISIQLNLLAGIPDFSHLDWLPEVAGIYAIKLETQNAVYVGQTANLKTRIRSHFRSLAFGTHINRDLQELFRGFDSDQFSVDVLDWLPNKWTGSMEDQSWLANREKYWITAHRSAAGVRCLNRTDGEFIDTTETLEHKRQKAIAEQQAQAIRDAAYDKRIKEEKLALKKAIEQVNADIDAEGRRISPLRTALLKHEEWLKKNSTFFKFFLSRDKKQELMRVELEKAKLVRELELEMEPLLKLHQSLKALKQELKSKKTRKQLDYYSSLRRYSLRF